jgi:FixJ family two-component response regulator
MKSYPKIYLSDDDDEARAGLSWLLRHHGFDVLAFRSGIELLSSLETKSSTRQMIFIIDVNNPYMSGVVLQERLIERCYTKTNPVIVLSGIMDISLATKLIEKGAFCFLEKPWKAEDILTNLLRAVEWQKRLLRAENAENVRATLMKKLSKRNY